MRESSVFEVRLDRFGVWRGAVVVLGMAAVAAVLAWAVQVAAAGDGATVWPPVTASLLAVATVALVRSLVRVPAGRLACVDGGWTFTPDAGAPCSGELAVALDWGSFLLLRLASQPRPLWLPVQRRGLEREWHALRCAVYAPARRAAAAGETASAGRR